MCIFHKWAKWIQYDKQVPEKLLSGNWRLSGAIEHWQKKKCKKCGKEKHDYIGLTVL